MLVSGAVKRLKGTRTSVNLNIGRVMALAAKTKLAEGHDESNLKVDRFSAMVCFPKTVDTPIPLHAVAFGWVSLNTEPNVIAKAPVK